MAAVLLTKVFLICGWCLFAGLYGLYDGLLWSMAMCWWDKGLKPKLHPHRVAFVLRALVAVVFSLCIFDGLDEVSDHLLLFVIYIGCFGLMFSLFHNGVYNETRHVLDGIRTGFFSSKHSSSGLTVKILGHEFQPFEFGFPERLMMFLAGAILLLAVPI